MEPDYAALERSTEVDRGDFTIFGQKIKTFIFFLSFKCLNHMLEDKSMSLMHKQQEKLVEIVDFDKFVLTAENVLQ